MHNNEQKILRLSMTLLFLALMIVYIIWYQLKGDSWKTPEDTQIEESTGVQIITLSGNDTGVINQYTGFAFTGENALGIPSATGTMTSGGAVTGAISTGTQPHTNIKILSGTSIYYGKIEIIEKLGIKHQYALVDSTGTWFIYLGTPSYDFASIARALKGTIYTMSTEQEIIENKLFGQKIVFINLPEYKNQRVTMLIYANDGIRLVQIKYDVYHKSKPYLKSLFID